MLEWRVKMKCSSRQVEGYDLNSRMVCALTPQVVLLYKHSQAVDPMLPSSEDIDLATQT